MNAADKYENYPLWIIVISNLVSLLICLLGAYIMFQLGIVYGILYLVFWAFLEYRIISQHCVNCFYYGKYCGFGHGRLSSLFFKKGNPSLFCKKEMKWKDMIPDLLVSLIPILVGIFLIIKEFRLTILLAIAVIIVLSTIGNGFVRGNLACNHCKQKDLGCPADVLFNKK